MRAELVLGVIFGLQEDIKMTRILIFHEPDAFGVVEVAAPAERVVRAINAGRGEAYLMGAASGPLYARLQGEVVVVTRWAPPSKEDLPKLSRREYQVLCLLGEGLTSDQIALKLGLRPRTVRSYVAGMKAKLQAQNIQQLVARAVALGLFRPEV
jgi:DNA-binding CsgD family transcriptional regulator